MNTVHNVEQGSQEWLDLRANYFTASEAPAMMGVSKYQTRNDLLALKKTGVAQQVTASQQRVFDRGHKSEAGARPIVEGMVGEELFPATLSRDKLLASMDGMDMLGTVLFEHKLYNDELAAQVRNGDLEAHYWVQLEQQLYVSGAERVIFVCSDGTEDNFASMTYQAVPGRIESILAGWAQFEKDLAAFEVAAPVETVKARSIENLPALVVKLTGQVSASNLGEYKAGALAFIDSIKTDLATDQDFADAEATVKFCEKAEKELKSIKDKALEDTRSIKELFDAIDEMSAAMRAKRLALDKLVKGKKEEVKASIRSAAEQAFANHVATINADIGPRVALPAIACDIAGAMKGKRSITSLQEAADTTLAKAKIEANEIADKIRANLKVLRELDAKYRGLFNDAQQIILKDADDFATLVRLRVTEADAEEKRKADEEAKRLEQERERIRQEEADRLERERQQQEQERQRQQQDDQQAQAKPAPTQEAAAPAPAADPEPVAEPQQVAWDMASGKDQTVYHAQGQTTVGKVPARFKLESMESLLRAILAGEMPMELVTIVPDAVAEYIAEHGYVPTGFSVAGGA